MITATSNDALSNIYVASFESYQYPIFSIQYHPEKAGYEWRVPANHAKIAVEFSAQIVNVNSFLKPQVIHKPSPIKLP